MSSLPEFTTKQSDEGSIVVWSWRVVPPGDEAYTKYVAGANTYAAEIEPKNGKGVPGLKTYMFSKAITMEGGHTLVSDIQWFNSIGAFRGHMGLYGNITIMRTMMGFVNNAEPSEPLCHFKGYIFGGWDKTWVGPVRLHQMFPNFPPAKWFEFREPAAGFIRNTESSTTNPPIFVLMEHKVADGKLDEFKAAYKKAADEMLKNPKTIAMNLTSEAVQVPTIDADKIRKKTEGFKTQNLLVSLECYEDIDTLKAAVEQLKTLTPLLEGPSGGYMHDALSHTGEIWADDKNAEVETLLKAAYHPDAEYKTYVKDAGFNNHKTACDGKCPEGDAKCAFSPETELGATCPNDLRPAEFKVKDDTAAAK
jgi:hypothetical protein